MKLLIVSDSHGNSQILDDLVERYQNQVDAFVHCGDSELRSSNLIWSMMDTVAGNCDYDTGFQQQIVKRDLKYPYLIVHGHQHDIRWTMDYLISLAKKKEVHFVFYGHSHVLRAEFIDGVFLINPGSIKSPRGSLRERTYCILDVEEERVVLRVFDQQHHELTTLKQVWANPF